MTLPASGAITASAINAELGASSTATLSLNSAYPRSLVNTPTGTISVNDYHSKYGMWLGTPVTTTRLSGVAIGADGNLSFTFETGDFARTSLGTTLLTQTNVSSTNQYQPAVDSSNNTIIATYTGLATACVRKVNSAGTVQWSLSGSGSGVTSSIGLGVCLGASSANYYAMFDYYTTNWYSGVVKISAAGSPQWQVAKSTASPEGYIGFYVDSSDNTYFLTAHDPGEYRYYCNLMKINSSGSAVWQRNISYSGGQILPGPHNTCVATDSSGNVYVSVCHTSNASVLLKYNASGTLLWQKQTSGFYSSQGCVACTPTGDVYWSIGTTAVYGDGMYVLKLDSAGTLLWQRSFSSSGFEYNPSQTIADAYGNLIIIVYTIQVSGSTGRLFVARLPSNGNGAGTYNYGSPVVPTYAASSLTLSSGALTDSAGGVGLSSSTLTFSTASESSTGRTFTGAWAAVTP